MAKAFFISFISLFIHRLGEISSAGSSRSNSLQIQRPHPTVDARISAAFRARLVGLHRRATAAHNWLLHRKLSGETTKIVVWIAACISKWGCKWACFTPFPVSLFVWWSVCLTICLLFCLFIYHVLLWEIWPCVLKLFKLFGWITHRLCTLNNFWVTSIISVTVKTETDTYKRHVLVF